jgi:hypothetical protein
MSDVEAVLQERGNRYGPFSGNATIAQQIKNVMRNQKGWERLCVSKKEALEMIAHKVARILNGDPTYADNWVDIAGYAKLVADQLDEVKVAPVANPLGGHPTVSELYDPDCSCRSCRTTREVLKAK